MILRSLLIALAMLASVHSAHAHGIAGNRFFPGTLAFDDPAVADEAILPNFSSFKRPGEGGNVVDNRFDWAFFRREMTALGLGCAKTPALAPHVEISLINCISESQNILHTRGSMPC